MSEKQEDMGIRERARLFKEAAVKWHMLNAMPLRDEIGRLRDWTRAYREFDEAMKAALVPESVLSASRPVAGQELAQAAQDVVDICGNDPNGWPDWLSDLYDSIGKLRSILIASAPVELPAPASGGIRAEVIPYGDDPGNGYVQIFYPDGESLTTTDGNLEQCRQVARLINASPIPALASGREFTITIPGRPGWYPSETIRAREILEPASPSPPLASDPMREMILGIGGDDLRAQVANKERFEKWWATELEKMGSEGRFPIFQPLARQFAEAVWNAAVLAIPLPASPSQATPGEGQT